MRIKRYYCLTDEPKHKSIAAQVLNCLDAHGVKYKTTDLSLIGRSDWYSFTVYEDEPVWKSLYEVLAPIDPADICYEYSQKELSKAQWLSIRSDNANKIFCDDRACDRVFEFVYHDGEIKHRRQCSAFEMNKAVKWNAGRFFYGSEGLSYTKLFTSDEGKKRLSENFNGLAFEKVLKTGTVESLPDIWQIGFLNLLPDESIVRNVGEKDVSCKECGRLLIDPHYPYRPTFFGKFLDPAIDFYTTNEIFYETGEPMLLVSHRAYEKLFALEMDSKLIFEPVIIK